MRGLGTTDGIGKSYLGVLLDGNHKCHPVAIGIGGQESTDEWLFFLHHILTFLKKRLGNNFCIFADEHAAIRAAVNRILPGFDKYFICMKHKQSNVAKYFGVEAGDLFRDLALSYTRNQYLEAHSI